MKQFDYENLLTQMCEHLGLPDAAALRQSGLLLVGGHDLFLQYDEVGESGVIQARLDMGMVAPDQREWVWYRLLVSNFEWGTNGVLGWGLTPDGDHAALAAQYPVAPHTTGVDLANWLRKLVACADAYWQALHEQRSIAGILSLAPLQHVVFPALPGAANWDGLVEAFCDHVGFRDRTRLLADGDTLAVEGVDMLLRHDKEVAPGRFEVRVDLGMEILASREKLWQGLLYSNFLMGNGGRMMFSVHPERDAVVLTFQQDLPVDATGEEFAELLRTIAGHVKGFWIEVRSMVSRADAVLQVEKRA